MGGKISYEIKDWIINNCFTKTGGLNNRVSPLSWWENKNIQDKLSDIINKTSWLQTENITQRIYHIINETNEIGKCKTCFKETDFRQFKTGYREYCCIYCVTQGEERNKKIAVNHDYVVVMKKVKETNLNKYGVESYYQTEEFKYKAAKTKMERYGNPFYNNMEQHKKTCNDKYGVDHFDLLKTWHVNFDEVYDLHFNKGESCVDIAKRFDVSFTFITKLIHKNGFKPIIQSVSSHEKEISEWLNSCNINHLTSDRKILNGKELDILIPENKVAIEINGLYWHSYDSKEKDIEINRHINKKTLAKESGIKLIQFTDKEWIEKKDICKSIILNSLGKTRKIRASKCEIIIPSEDEYREFLINNHIQGYIPASEKIALKFNNEIVSLMSIGKSRFSSNDWELLRLANKCNTTVYGAATKLFNLIKKDDMISYCSLDYFDGQTYEKLGFNFSHISKPNYFYVLYGSKIVNRLNAQKAKLSQFLEIYDEKLTEYQNMFNNGYKRYWNCGNSVWVYNKKEKIFKCKFN